MPTEDKPPIFLEKLLTRFLPGRLRESAIGDFAEEFADMASLRGLPRARLWYARQFVKTLAAMIIGKSFETGIMLKTAGTVTVRDIKRNPLYSFITVLGQAVGMACVIVIMLFVRHELSYDRFNTNADRIFRLTDIMTTPAGQVSRSPLIFGDVVVKLLEEFPEIRQVVRISPMNDFVVAYGDRRLSVNRYYADPSILDVFTLPVVRGDPKTALADPKSVVLSEGFARKLFGKEDPIGRTVALFGLDKAVDAQVTGIMKDMPPESHLHIPVLCPFQGYESMLPPGMRFSVIAYLLLDPQADPRDLETKLPGFIAKHLGDRYVSGRKFHLQALPSIHLGEKMAIDFDKSRDMSWIYFLSLAAFLILVISCINSAGLSVARSSRRAREVGLRRAVGAGKGQLIRQFLGEATAISFISLGFALILARILLVFFNNMMGLAIPYDLAASPWLLPALLAVSGIAGLLSGLYPAIVLSSYRPAAVMKATSPLGAGAGSLIGRGFVVAQFALSIIFIIGMLAAHRQMDFVRNKNLGFDKTGVLEIPIFKDAKLASSRAVILNELSGHPGIEAVVVTGESPGHYGGYSVPCILEGSALPAGINLNILPVGERYFEFFKIPLLAGRTFSAEFGSDSKSAVVLNESAVKALGLADPIGKTIGGRDLEVYFGFSGPARIIGVVKDFHNGTLHEGIKPALYAYEPDRPNSIFIRLRPGNAASALAFLEERWKRLSTHLPFAYRFINDPLGLFQYADDVRTRRLFTLSAGVALALACLGIFGISLLSAERRKKEIGIRKVLGASALKIVGQLSKDFLGAVLLANVIAWPLGYWIVMRWLGTFAYRVPVRPWLFVFAGGLALFIATATASVESLRAALANPVDTIRYE